MGIPTKALKAIIINDKEEILLLQRNPKIRETDNWDLPGGLLEEGEEEKTALKREVEEELGVEIEILKKGNSWKFFRPLDSQWVSVQNYICKIIKGEIILSEEHISYKWVLKKDLKGYPVKDKSFYNSIK